MKTSAAPGRRQLFLFEGLGLRLALFRRPVPHRLRRAAAESIQIIRPDLHHFLAFRKLVIVVVRRADLIFVNVGQLQFNAIIIEKLGTIKHR